MRPLLLLAGTLVVMPLLAQIVPPDQMPLTPPLLHERWVADMRSKNLEDILSLYVPDATFVSPDLATVSSSNEMRKLYVAVFTAYDSDITLNPPRHRTLGEPHHPSSLVDEGTYRERLRSRATGEIKTLCGGYTFTYVKAADGNTGWRISRMEWTDTPCPTPPAKP